MKERWKKKKKIVGIHKWMWGRCKRVERNNQQGIRVDYELGRRNKIGGRGIECLQNYFLF